MIENYEKTIEELNEYNDNNKLFLGIEDFTNEDFSFYLNKVDNVAITGPSASGKTVFLNSLLLQLTNKQITMNNLFIIDENISNYTYFIERGATYASTNHTDVMNLAKVIEKAYLNFKEGNPTILTITNFDRIREVTGKDITNVVKEMMESENATVILIEQEITSLNKLFNKHFIACDIEKRGHFLIEGKQKTPCGIKENSVIKPPSLLF